MHSSLSAYITLTLISAQLLANSGFQPIEVVEITMALCGS